MKIGIITRRAGYNMGSSLQAFAISKFIERLGFPNTIIKYNEYSYNWKWRVKPFINNIIYFIVMYIPFNKTFLKGIYTKYSAASIQQNKFKLFEKKYLNLTEKEYNSSAALHRDFNSTLDACICGSDQIWSPYFFDPVFYLNFITSPHIKKIAYAPSIGINTEGLIKSEQIELIKRFDAISCREDDGANLLSKYVLKKVPTVLDPTLMLDNQTWEDLASQSNLGKNEKYILTYFLHSKTYKDNIPIDFINSLSSETNLPVYNISLFNLQNKLDKYKQFNTIGPIEFLSLIKNAQWICTNSFHCTIFSFIFQKKFYVFERYMKSSTGDQNSRIQNLLNILSLQKCLQHENNKPNIKMELDFSSGQQEIEKRKQESINYLKSALQ